MMIDICVPFEDWEYNAVGHHRCYFVVAESILMIYLTVLYFRMRKIKTPTEMYIRNLLIIAWPLIPIRLFKTGFTFFFPLEASQSYLLCIFLRIETTLQYFFNLAHLLLVTYFARQVSKHRSVSFEVTTRMRRTLVAFNLFSFIISTLLVNLQVSSGIVKVFSCIYAIPTVIFLPVYVVIHFVANIKGSLKCFRRKKEGDENDFSYFYFYALQFFTSWAHVYQFCVVQTFLIPAIFPAFAGDYLITFRYVSGVLAVRFMVSIIFAAGPMILLPPVRRQIFRPILKLKQDRVAAVSEPRSADQIQVTFVN
ncbi:Serpentine Receptor, class Z [Caenorhabditis elegans]|uniref:Serpentine Receptor, class Z n=1 Tax=Caenorhabditis elegans TaxID=6239 RepID=G5EEB9_CAEEL|nr:Serpentine Receptor, class Z [Caenorhabditis elegans]CAE18000.1 Serpentine Receptor, class Z [Caenorhabditis elegans]|eukprot:NP_001023472.1 Uncharacterized protein CELE_Y45F10D.15 [Caenorhabditis elegans]